MYGFYKDEYPKMPASDVTIKDINNLESHLTNAVKCNTEIRG